MNRSYFLKYLKIFLAILFIGVTSYNFYIANNSKYEVGGDAWSFVNLGVTLAKTGKYGFLDADRNQILNAFKENNLASKNYGFHRHSTWRPPVWPFLIAGIFLLFGYNLVYIIIFKVILHLIGVFLFYKTLKLLDFNKILIIVGTFLFGVSPAYQIYSRVFLSEPITLFFITLWVYFLIRFIQKKSTFLPQAFVGGILVIAHPYYIFLPFLVWLVLFLYKHIKLKLLLISTAVCVSVISVWVVRNFIVLDTKTIIITTSSGAVMAKGWNKDVPEKHTNTKGDLANEGLVLKNYEYDRSRNYDEVEKMKLYQDASIHFIKSNPKLILPIIFTKLKSAFNPFPETPKPGILETGRMLFHFLSLLSLIFLIFFFKNSNLMKSLAVGLILSTIAITILTYSGFRFRMPQIGMELLFILFVIDKIQKRREIIP